jgi:RND superfamily putative drug exporter
VLGTFTVLSFIASITEVSVFAINLTKALGLGLAIDYCLLMVARYREELARGRDLDTALAHTVQTAGRTVLFSGATVASSLLALLVFPVAYLRSFAYAGIAVVFVACTTAVVLLPALLRGLGDRVGAREQDAGTGFWGRQTERVLRRPLAWAVGVGLVLVAAGGPFLGIDPGRIDERVLPSDNPARTAATILRQDFTFAQLNPIQMVIPDGAASDDEVLAYQSQLSIIPDMYAVDSGLGRLLAGEGSIRFDFHERFVDDEYGWYQAIGFYPPEAPQTEGLVEQLRATDTPWGPALVGGPTAVVMDTVDAVVSRVPLALGVIAVVTLIVLFLMTGSVLVPLKAVVLNLLSLTATFGAMVWIFQHGHLGGLLDVTATGKIDVFTPILMFCVAFGLSMDYEVFLLSRIKEEYDLTGDNHRAIVVGIGRTGPIVTAAAVLLAIVFLSVATSGVTLVRMFGIGLTIAVVVDAFLVRATLTPALMGMAGRANWWAPRPLRRFHLRWGLWENEPVTLPDETDGTRADVVESELEGV